jgi:hypothetical protein
LFIFAFPGCSPEIDIVHKWITAKEATGKKRWYSYWITLDGVLFWNKNVVSLKDLFLFLELKVLTTLNYSCLLEDGSSLPVISVILVVFPGID